LSDYTNVSTNAERFGVKLEQGPQTASHRWQNSVEVISGLLSLWFLSIMMWRHWTVVKVPDLQFK